MPHRIEHMAIAGWPNGTMGGHDTKGSTDSRDAVEGVTTDRKHAGDNLMPKSVKVNGFL